MKLPSTKLFGILMLLMMMTYMLGTAIIGGDALSGKIENNKYYIWDSTLKYENGIPVFKEVSKGIYFYSIIHSCVAYLLMAVWIVTIIIETIAPKMKRIKRRAF